MCQLSKGAQFKMKREKVKKLSVLFLRIRLLRSTSSGSRKTLSMTRIYIVSAIGDDDLQLAKLIYKRAKRAGLTL